MNELIDLVDDLKKELDNTKEVKEIREVQKEVEKDKDLLKMIEEYNETKDSSLKKKILSNKLFNSYKDKEINLNILIMSINKDLKKLKGDKSCNI